MREYIDFVVKTTILLVAFSAIMSGIASAECPELIDIEPSSAIILYDPEFVTYSVDVYNITNTTATHEINATVIGWGSGSADDLRFRFTNETGASSGWLSSGESWNWGTPQSGPNYEKLTMDVKAVSSAPPNNEYLIEVNDIGGEYSGGSEKASGTTMGTSIPEFATVAIPVAIALIGAFFFMRRRKERA